MNTLQPSPAEERWLEVAARLGTAVPRDLVASRAGGWRSTGPLARIALFQLGTVAAALVLAILGFGEEITLLFAGLIAAGSAEWLKASKRLHASGIEEGLCVTGFLMVALWFTTLMGPLQLFAQGKVAMLVLIAAAGAAGLRLLNPFITTCAAVALVNWLGSTAVARTLDQSIGAGVTAVAFGCVLAAIALALGAREFRRPSHDRMLDWLCAAMPVAAYLQHATWEEYLVVSAPGGPGTGRLATTVLMLALGAALLIAGLRRRRHAPLLGFMGCVACLAVELRFATTLATETWLIVYGLAALVAGFALDRYLRQPRNGVTSQALENREGPLDLLQTAGAALLAQRAAPEAPRAEPGITPGEGRFGGGGAGGSY
jgi:hypothetical protein